MSIIVPSCADRMWAVHGFNEKSVDCQTSGRAAAVLHWAATGYRQCEDSVYDRDRISLNTKTPVHTDSMLSVVSSKTCTKKMSLLLSCLIPEITSCPQVWLLLHNVGIESIFCCTCLKMEMKSENDPKSALMSRLQFLSGGFAMLKNRETNPMF